MGFNKIPSWFIIGITIYPLLILVGLIFSIITLGEFNFLYWLSIPSIMFDEFFKKCCESIANNSKLILFFGFVFWFFIGAILGLIVKVVKCSPLISSEEINIEEIREKELEEQNKPKEEPKEEVKEENKEEPNKINSESSTEDIGHETKEEIKIEENKEEVKEEAKEEPSEKSKPKKDIKSNKSKKQIKKKK